MNTVQKGNYTARKARRFYESLGYQVEATRRDRWRGDQDFFGLWDFICVKEDSIIFVQVKTNTKPIKEWLTKAGEWKCPNMASKEFVVYKDYQRGISPSIRQRFLQDS